MSDAVSAFSTTFWRQDVNWYVRQQSWTRSFAQVNQIWTQKLEATNPSPTPDHGGTPNLADEKLANAIDPQTTQGFVSSLESGSITDASGKVTSGYLLNLLA
jgi:hypothetical protein